MRRLERAFTEGGSLSWLGDTDPAAREARRAILVLLIVFVLGLSALLLLWSTQASGEAPEFRCNPGNIYTTKECP